MVKAGLGKFVANGRQSLGRALPALRISQKVSFLRPPHVRDFVKEGYFFVPRYELRGLKIPFTIHEIYTALTPSDSRIDWASKSAAAKQVENYNIKS